MNPLKPPGGPFFPPSSTTTFVKPGIPAPVGGAAPAAPVAGAPPGEASSFQAAPAEVAAVSSPELAALQSIRPLRLSRGAQRAVAVQVLAHAHQLVSARFRGPPLNPGDHYMLQNIAGRGAICAARSLGVEAGLGQSLFGQAVHIVQSPHELPRFPGLLQTMAAEVAGSAEPAGNPLPESTTGASQSLESVLSLLGPLDAKVQAASVSPDAEVRKAAVQATIEQYQAMAARLQVDGPDSLGDVLASEAKGLGNGLEDGAQTMHIDAFLSLQRVAAQVGAIQKQLNPESLVTNYV